MLRATLLAALGLVFLLPPPSMAQGIVPIEAAHALALERAWVGRVQVDPVRGKLEHLVLQQGMLLAQTSQGVVQAINPENGGIYWTVQLPEPQHPTNAPGASADVVAVTNGTSLYVLDRINGSVRFETKVRGMPCAGSTVADDLVYVPTTTGSIEAYELKRKTIEKVDVLYELDKQPAIFFGAGMPLRAPLFANNRIYWASDLGFVFGDDAEQSKERVRFPVGGKTTIGIAHRSIPKKNGVIYAGSHDGSVFALDDRRAFILWRYLGRSAIMQTPVFIKDAVYAATASDGLVKLEAETGRALWTALGARRFIAASNARVYAIDAYGRLMVIDANAGGVLAVLPGIELNLIDFSNYQNDRIYLASKTGLVQCLHEMQLTQPIDHLAVPVEKPAETAPAAEGDAAAATQ